MAFGPVGRTQPGDATPFNNATNGFVSDNVQSAIEEVVSFVTNPVVDQSYYVSKNGNDTTGNGTFGRPYLTITRALTQITDASITKRYVIIVGPGTFTENVVLEANVFIKGSTAITTILDGTVNINDATWNTAVDHRSGFQDITLNGVNTFNFQTQVNNTAGKLFLYNCRLAGATTVTAQGASNQFSIQDSVVQATLTVNGMITVVSGCVFNTGANIVINSSSLAAIPASAFLTDGAIIGNITATWTSNAAVTVNMRGLNIGPSTVLTASGASCTVNVNDGSLPIPANRSFVSSAVLNRVNDNFAGGLLSTTTNVVVNASAAPSAGQALVATSSTNAAWSNVVSLPTTIINATTGTNMSSTTDAVLNGMTTTPSAGTYIVLFNCDMESNTAGAAISISYYVAGVQVANTLRKLIPFDGGALSAAAARGIAALQHLVTLNGSQVIDVRWSISSGTVSAAARSMILLRVA